MNIKQIISEVACALFILLFTYAGVSKLLDYSHFRIEMGKSPLLAGIAGSLAWILPVFELGIAILLSIVKSRLTGLYFSLTLMTMFTTYLIIVLHFSQFVPCTCGGFIEKMTWNQHIVFNILFVIISLVAVMIYPHHNDQSIRSTKPL